MMIMESLLINSQQVVVQDHLLHRRRPHHHHRDDVYGSCSSSSSYDEEEDEEDLDSSSPTPLQDMSSLLLQLPLKRGLSKHYNGKSESFTSLSNVKGLEDLAKKENPINKRLKLCSPSTNNGSHFSSLINGRTRSTGFLKNNDDVDDDDSGD